MTTIFQNDLPDELEIKGDIAIDTEAMGLNIKRDRLCLLQLSNGDGKAYLVHFATPNYQAPNLRRLLSQDQQKIFHFARFDLTMIKNYLGIDMTNIFCTKIASIMARTYSSSHSLKEVCRELLGINLAKQACQSYWGGTSLIRRATKLCSSGRNISAPFKRYIARSANKGESYVSSTISA